MARARKTAPKPDEDAPAPDVIGATETASDAVDAGAGKTEVTDFPAPEVALLEPEASAVHPAREDPPPPPREIVRVEKRGGFGPLLLGGLVAGGLGFASAGYLVPRYFPQLVTGDTGGIGADLAGQAEKIVGLQAELDSLKGTVAAPATAAIPDEVTAGIAQLGDRLQSLEQAAAGTSDRIGKLEARMDAAESRPVTGDAASAGALDAIRREIEGYRTEIGNQMKAVEAAKGDIGAAAEAAAAKVATVEAEAERLRNEATAAAEEAARTGSLSLILSALESGAAIDAPLADLKASGVEVPAALTDQAQGVPTLASLRESFPEAARAALAATVRDASGTDAWGRITAFFRSQSGARSLAPRAGDDPDAILSRAEASLRAGDLALTLTELAGLPEAGRTVMAEWIARAERRQQAVTAAEALQQQVK
ncbi:MAG TPA: hypothetical protein PLI43_16615 [Albidovulum sp.]|uniref:COG4223 family protein n=1 Tax=Albidovulum sp. TaxID=1872424 RepID=UPI002C856154|nr:hypothetical protein [Albidovulum sp.]